VGLRKMQCLALDDVSMHDGILVDVQVLEQLIQAHAGAEVQSHQHLPRRRTDDGVVARVELDVESHGPLASFDSYVEEPSATALTTMCDNLYMEGLMGRIPCRYCTDIVFVGVHRSTFIENAMV